MEKTTTGYFNVGTLEFWRRNGTSLNASLNQPTYNARYNASLNASLNARYNELVITSRYIWRYNAINVLNSFYVITKTLPSIYIYIYVLVYIHIYIHMYIFS